MFNRVCWKYALNKKLLHFHYFWFFVNAIIIYHLSSLQWIYYKISFQIKHMIKLRCKFLVYSFSFWVDLWSLYLCFNDWASHIICQINQVKTQPLCSLYLWCAVRFPSTTSILPSINKYIQNFSSYFINHNKFMYYNS